MIGVHWSGTTMNLPISFISISWNAARKDNTAIKMNWITWRVLKRDRSKRGSSRKELLLIKCQITTRGRLSRRENSYRAEDSRWDKFRRRMNPYRTAVLMTDLRLNTIRRPMIAPVTRIIRYILPMNLKVRKSLRKWEDKDSKMSTKEHLISKW